MITIIPAVDLIDGKCVRLLRGDFAKSIVYSTDPVDVARRFEAAGLKRLHMVDLDGAKAGAPKNLTVLEKIARNTNLLIDFGGGIKTDADLKAVFNAGAQMANLGSVAIREPQLFAAWVKQYPGAILPGVDIRNRKVVIDGWKTETNIDVIDKLKGMASAGIASVFVTDTDRDGAMAGPSLELYREIVLSVPGLRLIASGGVRSTEDLDALDAAGCSGVIVGKAIYERTIEIKELSKYAG